MVWIPFFSNSSDSNKDFENNRKQRELCWESRDDFFNCLDKINVINSLDPKNEKLINQNCKDESKKFNKNCATSWINYFKQKRLIDFRNSQIDRELELKRQQEQIQD
ncbi:hypothetical protein KAFR_0B03590 [Kazachstania africana CBS 2517]|uniref:Cytochrome c oxidase assembly factor 6 n=1 Tax=Kazachstania africana (strain ATCC 22294 / BCRC 22015 / CBS 2517 / CECT 1963 / NBRC 1671 / NRRL Y-8276) TaxID=1071382 RepID=H2AQK6_KAZAF|nr:hypothetical protein KAFR_0B03590 [Kazachstania africana CBS 2517]CCF56656.1 hypothetical protein KAFR_0B03590 [Kazachstania africana CBS 2517]